MMITLEHAVTHEQQAKGLMYRDSLPENHGMTFSYTCPKKRTFWSQNCLIDLDIAFLDENHVILEIDLLKCKPVMRITSEQPAQYVVEMPAGFFEKNGILPGDQIIWESAAPTGSIIRSGQPLLKKEPPAS